MTIPQAELREHVPTILEVHNAVKATLELARSNKVLGSSLQSSVYLFVEDRRVATVLEKYSDELDAIFVVSSVHINQSIPEGPEWSFAQEFDVQDTKVKVHVLPPQQAKCLRCWRYMAPAEDSLCGRCDDVVEPERASS